MSWSSRLGSWSGKFSPFGRPSPSADNTQVTDQDFSYITSDDIKRTQEEARAARPPRDTDVLVLKRNRVSYPIHFPAYSIDDGELTVGKIREAATSRLDLPTSASGRIKLLYKGKTLKEDSRLAREEGLRSDLQAELLMVVGDQIPEPASESEDDDQDAQSRGDKKKKKSKRRKKKSGRGSNSGTATPEPSVASSSSALNPDATYAPSYAPPPRKSTPPVVKPAQTAIEKLDELASHFHTNFVPACVQFVNSPPTDQAKRDFDHKRLTETVLAQVLLKLDAVETEGNEEARQRRKALVKEVQGILNQLDDVMKK